MPAATPHGFPIRASGLDHRLSYGKGVSDGVASIHYPEPGAEDQPLVDTAVERVLLGAWENQSASIEAARIGVPPNLPNRSSFISLGEPGLEGQVLTINLVLQTEPGGRKPERFCIMYKRGPVASPDFPLFIDA
ncbi:MAG TPA: hypothetical protein VN939_06430 [Chthoniobacterales bacterium]|nr:hypothetical protein [Chthoniobacterales bacterium]